MGKGTSLTEKEALVLQLLVGKGDTYGQQLVTWSDGDLKLGTIYVLLGRMVDKGYLASRQERAPRLPGMPRRYYTLTGLGAKALHFHEMSQIQLSVLRGGA